MTAVRINGEESTFGQHESVKIVDLVELIKNQIDPDHMITGIFINGQDLSENDWHQTVGTFGQTAIIEVDTGTPNDYVSNRLAKSADVVRACFIDFRDARKFFQSGDMQNGNKKLAIASNTLKAFFQWYASLIDLLPQENKAQYNIDSFIGEITECFKKACQHQLYQSWWALGECLEKELEVKLDKLEDFCRGANSVS
jgi:hypothetical protein